MSQRTKAQRETLKGFTDMLRSVPPHKFDFSSIVSDDDDGSSRTLMARLLKHTCGTTACGYGYLPTYFRDKLTYRHGEVCIKRTTKPWDNWSDDVMAFVCEQFGLDVQDLRSAFGINSNDKQEYYRWWAKGDYGYDDMDQVSPWELADFIDKVAADHDRKYGVADEPVDEAKLDDTEDQAHQQNIELFEQLNTVKEHA